MADKSEKIRIALEQQEREQILYKALHTTPLQRILWIEEMLGLLKPFARPGQSIKTDSHPPRSSTL